MIRKEIGNYRILDYIGKGGMAVVYRGQHRTLTRRTVAIKVLSAALEGDQSFHERFFREAEVMARLDHPNIVTLWDFIEQDGQYFIVMEYVDGPTLHQIIKQSEGPLPLQQISKIFNQVLEALGYAHRLGIVHRDIKPSNIMINKKGEVKVTDFGIARIIGENFETTLTATGMGLGSPYYMSPEQVLASKKHPITAASDIYSLGITLYQMLTGKLPFAEGGSLYTVMQSHIKDIPPPPSQFRPGIPSNLEEVVLKAIEKRPEDRWLSCEDFKEALEKAISQEAQVEETLTEPIYVRSDSKSVSEIPPTSLDQRTVRKSFLGPVFIIVLLIAGIGLAGGGYYYLSRQKEAPNQNRQIRVQLAKSQKTKPEPQIRKAPPVNVSHQALTKKAIAQKAQHVPSLQEAKQGSKNSSHVGLQSEEQRRLTIEAKLARAEAYLDADRYAKAAMEAEAVLKIDKNNPKAKRILDAARKGARKRAIEQKRRAEAETKRAPSKEEIVSRMVTRAERFLETGQFHKARVLADKILDIDPENKRAQDILELAMEEENKLIFQRLLGKGTPAAISDDGTAAFDDKAEPNPHSPTPPFPVPLIPND